MDGYFTDGSVLTLPISKAEADALIAEINCSRGNFGFDAAVASLAQNFAKGIFTAEQLMVCFDRLLLQYGGRKVREDLHLLLCAHLNLNGFCGRNCPKGCFKG